MLPSLLVFTRPDHTRLRLKTITEPLLCFANVQLASICILKNSQDGKCGPHDKNREYGHDLHVKCSILSKIHLRCTEYRIFYDDYTNEFVERMSNKCHATDLHCQQINHPIKRILIRTCFLFLSIYYHC